MTIYNIRLKGHLDRRWEAIFDGFTITHRMTAGEQPITIMTGQAADQSALYGILGRLRDLGAYLISVQPEEAGEARESTNPRAG